MQIILNEYGQYLGVKGQSFAVYQKKKLIQQVPFYKTDSVVLKNGNNVSTSALFWLATYGIDTVIMSPSGKPLSLLLPLSSDKRVKTRMKQQEVYFNHKGVEIAKAIVKAKVENQALMLEEYGFSTKRFRFNFERLKGKSVEEVRARLTGAEGSCSGRFFRRYIKLFPKCLRPSIREKYRAVQPMNNVLNLAYEILKGEVYKSVVNAHLDPYLGFLHSLEFGKPSLVCDMQELFRIVVEHFLLGYVTTLDPKDSFEKRGKRFFLTTKEEARLIREINRLLSSQIKHTRITTTFGKKCQIRTAIKEESVKLGQYIRGEKSTYTPLIVFPKIS